MDFDVARSTTQGIAKASERGTGNEEIPRFFICACFAKSKKCLTPSKGSGGKEVRMWKTIALEKSLKIMLSNSLDLTFSFIFAEVCIGRIVSC